MRTETDHASLSWTTGYIWGIADDLLRDLYVRGKYRDVILPMTSTPEAALPAGFTLCC